MMKKQAYLNGWFIWTYEYNYMQYGYAYNWAVIELLNIGLQGLGGGMRFTECHSCFKKNGQNQNHRDKKEYCDFNSIAWIKLQKAVNHT